MVDTCIIYNPAAGRGQARRWIELARKWAAPNAELRASTGVGHAIELAQSTANEGFRRIIAAGGDGTVHEVANGVLRSGKDCTLGVWPLGSANDYAAALGILNWWKKRGTTRLRPTKVDVAIIRGGGRELYYVNCLGIGFNGLVSAEARKIRGLRGLPLYTLALLKTLLWQFATPPLQVQLDGKVTCRSTLSLSLNLGSREGGFPISKAARLDDGQLDVLHVGGLRRWELLRYMPALITGDLPTGHPELSTGLCRRATISSDSPLCIHADGEMFLVPADGVKQVEVEIQPGQLTVEVGWPVRGAS